MRATGRHCVRLPTVDGRRTTYYLLLTMQLRVLYALVPNSQWARVRRNSSCSTAPARLLSASQANPAEQQAIWSAQGLKHRLQYGVNYPAAVAIDRLGLRHYDNGVIRFLLQARARGP